MMRGSIQIAALIVAIGLLPLTASAQLKVGGGGVEVMAPNTGAAVSPPDSSTATIRDTRRAGGQTLRCWQSGRLLYEGSGFRGGLERSPNAIGVPRRAEGDPVVVLDLKDGLCIMSDG
jgi:hypothetical protein